MAAFNNWIPDINRFGLAGPPVWFQHRLWEYDPSLAVVPSRQGFYYRLGQRRQLKLPEKVINDVLKEQADTAMLARYGLIPVTTILATANWSNPLIFVELTRRAPWRMGGAKSYEERILAQERQEQINQAVKQDGDLTYLAKDAWRYYNKQIGTRSHLYSPVTKAAPALTGNRAPSLVIPGSPYRPSVMTQWQADRHRQTRSSD